MKKILGILFLFLLTEISSAQDDVSFTRYSQEEGMPAVTIRQIFQDGRGFLWIMTEQGIHRYDGYTFKTFRHDPEDPFSIAGNKPYVFVCDSARNPIFLFTNSISVYDPALQRFRNYSIPQLISQNGMPVDISISKNDYARNRCWFISTGKLIEFNPTNGQSSSYKISEPDKRYSVIVFTSDHTLLLFEENRKSVIEFNTIDKTFRNFPDPAIINSLSRNNSMMELSGNGVFLDNVPGTTRMVFAGDRLFFFDSNNPEHPTTYVPKLTNEEHAFVRIFLIGDEIWVATMKGKIIAINPLTGKETLYDVNVNQDPNGNNRPIYSIIKDDEGDIWATSDGLGLIRINPSTGKAIQYSELKGNPNSIWSSSCNSILNHRSGVMWVSFLSKGLVKIEKQKKNIPTYLPLNPAALKDLSGKQLSADVRAVLALDSTHVLVGALSNLCVIDTKTGIADFVRNKNQAEIIPQLSEQNLYTAFVRDRKGNIIIGTWKQKYFVYNPSTDFFKEYSEETGFKIASLGDQTRALMIDSRNRLWFATERSVAVMDEDSFLNSTPETFRPKTFSIAPGKSNGITGLPGFCLYEDKNKNVWVGTAHGLNRISPDGEVEQFTNDQENLNSLSENDVRCVGEDDEGNIWIATNGGGINKFNPSTKKFSAYTMRNGLPDDAIYTFLFSAEKNIWLSCNRGLAEFNPANGTVKKFTPYDGLQNYEYNTNAAGKMPGGELIFGGTSGVNIFDPSKLNSKSFTPEVALNSFKIFNHELSLPQEGITVSHNQNNLAFEFAVLSFYRSEENQYAYKMDDFDADWIYCGNLHTAVYNNLPPGNYIFNVKGCNSVGVWNEKGISYPITILPPWWQTWWARTLGVFALFFGIFFFIQFRTGTLRKQRAELEEKVEERTTALKSSQQQLIQQEKLASLGQLTSGIAHELKNPLNFVTNFADISVGLVDEMKHTTSEEDRTEILSDLEINLSKINEHGKRADSIVQNMLQHARTGTGSNEMRPTDINSFCDECLDLAYESAKAGKQNFRCTIEKQFDPTIQKINIVPQEISRVLMSLLNNSFYAVREKSIATETSETKFTPKISLVTQTLPHSVTISISDNGNGIPDSIIEKIFQPFFTTKPAGQGTGLGLSISYDIIKTHGGEIKVKTEIGAELLSPFYFLRLSHCCTQPNQIFFPTFDL